MLTKVISESLEVGKLKFSYQEPTAFAKELMEQKVGNSKLYNITSEKLDGGIEFALALGNMTTIENVDAWVIPEFDYQVSEGGVARSILERAKELGEEKAVMDALKSYQKIVDSGTNFGYAHITNGFRNHGPKAFVHVVTAEVPSDVAHDMIKEATYNALMTADAAGIESIAFPALNTGMSASFSTPYESAQAMFEGIQQFMQAKDGQQVVKKVVIVSYQEDDDGKLKSTKDVLTESRKKTKRDEKTSIMSYGPTGLNAFIQELYGKFWSMTRSKGTDLGPEFSIAKKVVLDLLEDVGGLFFNLLDEEEARQLKIDITAKLLQASKANPEAALSKEFLLEFIRSISEFTIEDAAFNEALTKSVAQYKKDLDEQTQKLQMGIKKIKETIEAQVEALNKHSNKKVTAQSPRFGKLNDQMAKASDFIVDCQKLKACVERITRKVVDENEFKELQSKYKAAQAELAKMQKTSKEEMTGLQKRLADLKRSYDGITNEKQRLELELQRAQQRQPVHAPTYRASH